MTQNRRRLVDLLCEPVTFAPLHPVQGGLETEAGVFYPDVGGFPSLMPGARSLRARFWEWVYNRTAFGYDFGVRFAWQLSLGGAPIERQSYLSELVLEPGMKILETGTGTGDNLLAMPAGIDLFGIDQSIGMLRRCGKKLAAAKRMAGLVRADMHAVPFRSGLFDVVLHVGGLQFASHPGKAIHDWHRTAAGGGQVVIVEESASIRSILQRDGVRSIEDLVPPGAVEAEVRKISGGELTLIQYRKA